MSLQLARFLTIDRLLRSPQRHTVASIAQELETSDRTIQVEMVQQEVRAMSKAYIRRRW